MPARQRGSWLEQIGLTNVPEMEVLHCKYTTIVIQWISRIPKARASKRFRRGPRVLEESTTAKEGHGRHVGARQLSVKMTQPVGGQIRLLDVRLKIKRRPIKHSLLTKVVITQSVSNHHSPIETNWPLS